MFVNLHNHSYYSLLDGLPKPEEYIIKAKEHGSPGIALTDHGVLYGTVEFYIAGKKHGINPILGCETYLTPNSRFSKNPSIDSKRYHLILLAETNEGYENLIQLITKANMEGMYYKPRIDWDLLETYHKGLIALSSCLGGEIAQTINNEKGEEELLKTIRQYQNVFGAENFFLELQPHFQMPEQVKVNNTIKELSKRYNIPVVATSDAHYIEQTDNIAQDILLCVETNKTVDDTSRFSMMECDCSLRSPEKMIELFQDIPEAVSNTLQINERCKVDIKLGQNLIPSFEVPAEESTQSYMRKLCFWGLENRYKIGLADVDIGILAEAPVYDLGGKSLGDITPEELKELSHQSVSEAKKKVLGALAEKHQNMIARLEYELVVINTMGFDTYFLIVQDFVNWAKEQGIAVGPGRGSAAGALVAYVLGITDLDPLEYDLLFERFLNPARISMPDIDMDFADNRRDKVIEYVRDKYGSDHVAQISTFGTLAARQAVKDVGRAMGISFGELNEVAKFIPEKPGTKLKEALDTQVELKKLYEENPLYKKVFDIALKLEGVVRHISVHACAVIVSKEPLTKYTALQTPPNERSTVITQLSAKPLEEIGLLKIDFLGLRNLSIIQRCLSIIERVKQQRIDISTIPLDDTKAYQVFARGETTGVFQFESAGMRRYLKDLKPTCFDDIIAMVALYRPGPMELIPSFIKRKYGLEKITYIHPRLEPILKNTYGIGVYQEQMMQIARDLAGFTLAEADTLRKAIGKKIKSLLDEQGEKLVKGMVQNGIDEKTAQAIWELFPPFARYGFNKSHAACYALIAYQTAYLKAHYPTEFMTALLTSDAENTDRVALEVHECRQMGIEVLAPSINESRSNFTMVSDKIIRFGLRAIKGLGENTIQAILEEREKTGPFRDISDMACRVPVDTLNKKSLESLILSGSMDNFGPRKALLQVMDIIVETAKSHQLSASAGQTSLFSMGGTDTDVDMICIPGGTVETAMEKLKWEKAFLGLYISGHPLDGLKKYIGKKAYLSEKISEKDAGKEIPIMGLVTKVKKMYTKNKEAMMYLTLEDPTGLIEVVIFPKTLKTIPGTVSEDTLVKIRGRLDRRNGSFQVSCNELRTLSIDQVIANAQEEGFFDPTLKVVQKVNVEQDEHEGEALPVVNIPLAENSLGTIPGEPVPSTILIEEEIEKPAMPEENTPMFIERQISEDYIIEIPQSFDTTVLKELRSVLETETSGEQQVIIHMGGKVIRTNFKISRGGVLENKVRNLLEAPQEQV